jgi:hypothetical protein
MASQKCVSFYSILIFNTFSLTLRRFRDVVSRKHIALSRKCPQTSFRFNHTTLHFMVINENHVGTVYFLNYV